MLHKKRKDAEYEVQKKLGCFTQVFTDKQEKNLATYLIGMEIRLFGLTYEDLRELVFQLAVDNNIPHLFKGG